MLYLQKTKWRFIFRKGRVEGRTPKALPPLHPPLCTLTSFSHRELKEASSSDEDEMVLSAVEQNEDPIGEREIEEELQKWKRWVICMLITNK